MPIITRNIGNTNKEIKNYTSNIVNRIFPELKKFGIDMISNPFTFSKVTAAYIGTSYKDDTVKLYFNCIHSMIDKEFNSKTAVFVEAEYNGRYFKIGTVDTSNGSESAEIIYSGLYESGYRTKEDEEKERIKQQEEKQREEKEKQAELDKKKAEIQDYIDDKEKEETDIEQSDNEEYINDVNDSIKTFSNLFDIYLTKMTSSNMINSNMVISIMLYNENKKGQFLGINLFYVTSKNCLIQTDGINPKIDEVTTWEKAKNYCINVSKNLNGILNIYAYNENGKEIELTPEELSGETNQADLGVSTGVNL